MSRLRYRLVFFDVDSTLVTVEGIDILGQGNPEVARLTAAAMNAEIPLEEVYERRLAAIRPSRADVEKLAKVYCQSLVEGAQQTITTLLSGGAVVHLVTAGIEQAILPLAAQLGVPKRQVHAVRLRFSESGEYEDFDRRSYLTRSGGKEVVVRDIRARSHGRAALIGDGASDLEAKPAVDLFIGFGGVQSRSIVREHADAFVESPSLTAVLPFLQDAT
jgi:Haloacid Dehalogenase superfamily, subfamily IB, phosphoserine phosphatase-like